MRDAARANCLSCGAAMALWFTPERPELEHEDDELFGAWLDHPCDRCGVTPGAELMRREAASLS